MTPNSVPKSASAKKKVITAMKKKVITGQASKNEKTKKNKVPLKKPAGKKNSAAVFKHRHLVSVLDKCKQALADIDPEHPDKEAIERFVEAAHNQRPETGKSADEYLRFYEDLCRKLLSLNIVNIQLSVLKDFEKDCEMREKLLLSNGGHTVWKKCLKKDPVLSALHAGIPVNLIAKPFFKYGWGKVAAAQKIEYQKFLKRMNKIIDKNRKEAKKRNADTAQPPENAEK